MTKPDKINYANGLVNLHSVTILQCFMWLLSMVHLAVVLSDQYELAAKNEHEFWE